MTLTPLLANAGVPLLAVYWGGAFVVLIPIILIEAALFRYFTSQGWRPSLWISSLANLASTAIGLPIVWAVFLLVEFLADKPDVTTLWGLVQTAAWLPPMPDAEFAWRTPMAALILCGPFFLASVAVEGAVAKFLADTGMPRLWDWSWSANTLTYGGVALFFAWTLSHP